MAHESQYEGEIEQISQVNQRSGLDECAWEQEESGGGKMEEDSTDGTGKDNCNQAHLCDRLET